MDEEVLEETQASDNETFGREPHNDTRDYLGLLAYEHDLAVVSMEQEGLLQPPDLDEEEASSMPSRSPSWKTWPDGTVSFWTFGTSH
jgi:hypothetical protein